MTTTIPSRATTALNFVLVQVMALLTLSALSVLTINLIAKTNVQNYLTEPVYAGVIVYSEVLPALVCGFFAGLFFRSKPFLLSVVMTGIKTCVRIFCTPYVVLFRHFWVESGVSLITAFCGAWLACMLMNRFNKREPANLIWTALAALMIPAVAWLVTLRISIQR